MKPVAFFYDRHVGSRLETNMKQWDHVLLADRYTNGHIYSHLLTD